MYIEVYRHIIYNGLIVVVLQVLVSFAEIRNSQDSREFIAPNRLQIRDQALNERGQSGMSNQQNTRRVQSARFYSESLESRLSLLGSRTQPGQAKKVPLFSWKRLKSKIGTLNDNKTGEDKIQVDQQLTSSPTEVMPIYRVIKRTFITLREHNIIFGTCETTSK